MLTVSNVVPEILPAQHTFFYCLDSIDTVWSLPDLNVKMTSVVLTTLHLFPSDLYMLFSGSFLNKHEMAHRLDCVISSCHTALLKRDTLFLFFPFSPMRQIFDFCFFYRCGL